MQYNRVALILLVLLYCSFFFTSVNGVRPKFEAVTGIIDDCCCDVQTVDHSLYDEHMHATLADLVSSTFFRYFKVNYLKECPFWDERALCSIDGPGECGICECDENEIPQAWNVKPTNKESIVNWKEKDEDVWIIQDDTEDTLYVNLQTNPERYTGYGGGTSNNIWLMIYKENCFPDPYECTEERVFYRLISGLHASTTAHICENFHQPDNTWAPNLDMFTYRLGAFPDRLKNIYFTFVYLLRAAKKASDFLSTYDYYTSHPEEDKRIQSLVKSLLSSNLLCSNTFDESTLFLGERAVMKREFMTKFRNISQIMDCVSCQTCKVHAKLQILGIATATKILIADDPNIMRGLQHNEISALINTLFKFSESIQIIHNMKVREDAYLKLLAENATIEETSEQNKNNNNNNPNPSSSSVPSSSSSPSSSLESNPFMNPQSPFYHYISLFALISAVVLITVATLYSQNLFPNNNSKNKKRTIESKSKEANNTHNNNNNNNKDNNNTNVDNTSTKGTKTSLRKSSEKVSTFVQQ